MKPPMGFPYVSWTAIVPVAAVAVMAMAWGAELSGLVVALVAALLADPFWQPSIMLKWWLIASESRSVHWFSRWP